MRLNGEFVGQALGAALFVAVAALPFIVDGVSFAMSAVILLAVIPVQTLRARHRIGMSSRPIPQLSSAPHVRRRPLRDDVVEGARFLFDRPELRLLVATIASLALCQAMVLGVLVLYASGPAPRVQGSYGLFLAVAGIGRSAGACSRAGSIARSATHSCLVIGAAGASVGYALLALPDPPRSPSAGFSLKGSRVSLGNVASMSLRQELVPLVDVGSDQQRLPNGDLRSRADGCPRWRPVADLWSLRGAILVAAAAQTLTIVRRRPTHPYAAFRPGC